MKLWQARKACIFVLMLAVLLGAGQITVAAQYTIIDLGALGGDSSDARAINEGGQVVGQSDTVDGETHAFLWKADTGMQDLDNPYGYNSWATAVNDLGQVVGSLNTGPPDYHWHEFFWEAGTGMREIGTLGGIWSVTQDINEGGQVVGYAETEDDTAHAFLWEADTGMQDLGTLDETVWDEKSLAFAINEGGQVVGEATASDGNEHAFLWEAGPGLQDLGAWGEESRAFDVNNSGQVVGRAAMLGEEYHAFLWEADTGVQNLGDLYGYGSAAEFINEAGQVVGSSETADGKEHAFLWEASAGMQDLNNLIPEDSGWELFEAVDINNTGWIVGNGSSGVGIRAFLLIPADENVHPDLWIKQGPSWLGDDIYNTDATDQTAIGTVGSSQTQVYRARLYNDGVKEETFWIRGPGGDADWTVQYYWGTEVNPARKVTTQVTSSKGWRRANVPPGGKRNFVIAVTPAPGMIGSYPVLVTATSDSDPDQVDCIQAITTVPDVQPDLHIKKGPEWGGDDTYNDDGTDQKASRKIMAGSPALFRARLENDGVDKDHFYIKGPTGNEDWTVQYHQGGKVDASKEVTAEVTSAEGWKRPNIVPGAVRRFLIMVTPRSGLPADSQFVSLVRAEAGADPTQQDTIKMVTRVKAE